MMDKIIICDECGCEGCTVSEILPKSRKISMRDFAAMGKSPYAFGPYSQQQQVDRKWKIFCEKCGHAVFYTEVMRPSVPYFSG